MNEPSQMSEGGGRRAEAIRVTAVVESLHAPGYRDPELFLPRQAVAA